MLKPTDIFRPRGELVTRRIVGETLLVPISGRLATLDEMFSLNGTGDFIWERLDGATALGSVRDALCEHYEVEPDVAWSDLDELVTELFEAELVERVGDDEERVK